MPRDARDVSMTVVDDRALKAPPEGTQHGTNGNGNGHSSFDVEVVPPTNVVKRDGRIAPFDVSRIENALSRCFAGFDRTPSTSVQELARRVVNIIAAKANVTPPTVEEVQDVVEMILQAAGEFEAAKRYILYRHEHSKQRE